MIPPRTGVIEFGIEPIKIQYKHRDEINLKTILLQTTAMYNVLMDAIYIIKNEPIFR